MYVGWCLLLDVLVSVREQGVGFVRSIGQVRTRELEVNDGLGKPLPFEGVCREKLSLRQLAGSPEEPCGSHGLSVCACSFAGKLWLRRNTPLP